AETLAQRLTEQTALQRLVESAGGQASANGRGGILLRGSLAAPGRSIRQTLELRAGTAVSFAPWGCGLHFLVDGLPQGLGKLLQLTAVSDRCHDRTGVLTCRCTRGFTLGTQAEPTPGPHAIGMGLLDRISSRHARGECLGV